MSKISGQYESVCSRYSKLCKIIPLFGALLVVSKSKICGILTAVIA